MSQKCLLFSLLALVTTTLSSGCMTGRIMADREQRVLAMGGQALGCSSMRLLEIPSKRDFWVRGCGVTLRYRCFDGTTSFERQYRGGGVPGVVVRAMFTGGLDTDAPCRLIAGLPPVPSTKELTTPRPGA